MLEKTGLKVKVLRVTGAKDRTSSSGSSAPTPLPGCWTSRNITSNTICASSKTSTTWPTPCKRQSLPGPGALLLSELDSPVEQEVYAGQLAGTTGVGKSALLQEIQRCQDQRLRAAKKKQARRTLTPVTQIQPKARQLRYDNPRSARAEEGILRLLMLDGTLVKNVQGLEADQFSSPVLGKIYGVLLGHLQGGDPSSWEPWKGSWKGRRSPCWRRFWAGPPPWKTARRPWPTTGLCWKRNG